MTTNLTPLAAGITNALGAGGVSRIEAARLLGMDIRTFNKYIDADKFTFRDIQILSAATGVKIQTILSGVVAQESEAA